MRRVAVMVVMLVVGAVHAEDESRVMPPYDAKQAFAEVFDGRSLEAVRTAKRVEVIRLANDPGYGYFTAVGDGGVDSLDGFAVARRFFITDSTLVARLKTLTLNPAAYRWYNLNPSNGISEKMCGGFQPKVAFRFGGDPLASVDVFLCFNCEDLGVRTYGKATFSTPQNTLADMAMPAEWLALEKAALPDDEYIQRQVLHGHEPKPWSPDGGPF